MASHAVAFCFSTPHRIWRILHAQHISQGLHGVKKFLAHIHSSVGKALQFCARVVLMCLNVLCFRSNFARALVYKKFLHPKTVVHPKTVEEYVEHIALFNARVELSSWSCQYWPPRANKANNIISIYKINRICTWRPRLATPAAWLHTCVEEEDVLHIFLYGFWC